MVQEDYCSFEVAKLLKEKGFNEQCSSTYDIAVSGGKPIFYKYDVLQFFPDGMKNSDDKYGMVISAPTHQMAMKWLREVHKVVISIDAHTANHWDGYIDRFEIDILKNASRIIVPYEIAIYNTYEEAVEAALKYSLENLI